MKAKLYFFSSVVFLLIMASFLLVPLPSMAATLSVPSTEYPTIQSAIDAAVDGDKVEVGDGTYVENINFLGKAITVKSVNGKDVTTLDGGAAGSVVTISSGEGAGTVLDGFTITNGSGTYYENSYYGGGIFILDSSPTIKNCNITDNTAINSGASIYCNNSSVSVTNCTLNNGTSYTAGGIFAIYSSPTITDCIITGHSCTFNCGIYGLYSTVKVTNTEITGNTAGLHGGGICLWACVGSELTDCTISGNTAGADTGANGQGGGVYSVYSSPTYTNCTISDNHGAAVGGGIYSISYPATPGTIPPTITDCTISNNSADSYGGGVYLYGEPPTITNTVITGNSAPNHGGGMYIYYSSVNLVNSTVSGNSAGLNGGGIYVVFRAEPVVLNSILWGNTAGTDGNNIYMASENDDPLRPISIDVSYSDVGGGWAGTGNIDIDPLFVGGGDYHLTEGSLCIDAGNPVGAPLTDRDGKLREGNPDIGAYEHTNTAPVADAGPDQVITLVGTVVQLDGTGSYDDDEDPLTYLWEIVSKPEGSVAALSDSSAVSPTFVADVNGEYLISLTVSDAELSSTDEVLVSFNNVAPVANPGEYQVVVIGNDVNLDGTGSTDANGDPLTYSWSFDSTPEGSTAVITEPSEGYAVFTPDLLGTYIVTLVANDGIVDSEPVNVMITVITAQDAAQQTLDATVDYINGIDPEDFRNPGSTTKIFVKVDVILTEIDKANYQVAYDHLVWLIERADGCTLRGAPDTGGGPHKRDEITDCEDQIEVYNALVYARDLIEGLL